jgi:hypothetical protein
MRVLERGGDGGFWSSADIDVAIEIGQFCTEKQECEAEHYKSTHVRASCARLIASSYRELRMCISDLARDHNRRIGDCLRPQRAS